MLVGGWTTAGGAVVVPVTWVAAALLHGSEFNARAAGQTGVGIAHISADTLQAGVDMIYRGTVRANDLQLDLLYVAALYIDRTS